MMIDTNKYCEAQGLTPPDVGAADASSAMDKPTSIIKIQATSHWHANEVTTQKPSDTVAIALTPIPLLQVPHLVLNRTKQS